MKISTYSSSLRAVTKYGSFMLGSIPGPATLDQTYVNAPIPRDQYAPSALPIFQYPGIADPATETMPSRYKEETININLRRAVTVTGSVVTAPRFPGN